MKKFPRIHRLSTVNIIYHQDYDYDFDKIRTDFAGDSGVGKSLIADLLQLIFVGSGFFKTATLSDGERPPRTMVFQKKGIDMGYAFLNIEKSPNQFIVIGVYIQNNETQTKSFVIQNGFNFEEDCILESFDKPLSYKDFIRQNDRAVRPIDVNTTNNIIENLLETRQLGMKVMNHRQYFKILSNNEIIPLEFVKYEESVKIYTEIIRTFARGNKIDFSKDNELKRFLFGEKEKNTIFEKYENIKNDIEKNIIEHGDTLKDIENIKEKQAKLKELLERKKAKEETNDKWLIANIGFCKYQFNQASQFVNNATLDIVKNFQSTHLLDKFLEEKKGIFEKEKLKIDEIFGKPTDIKHEFQRVQKVYQWLDTHQKENINNLTLIYQEQRDNYVLKIKITELETKLNQLYIFNDFKESNWVKGFSVGLDWNNNEIAKIEVQILEKELLENFSNLDNVDSLGYWAVNSNKPFTIEQESILMYFQKLSTQKPLSPIVENRYLPNPSSFFENPIIFQENKNGFWLNLGGVYEFIEYVEEQKLSPKNFSNVIDNITTWNDSLKGEISELKLKEKQLRNLLNHFKNISSELIDAYAVKDKINRYAFDNSLNVSEGEFQSCLNSYFDKDRIEKEYKIFEQINNRRDINSNNLLQTGIILGLIKPILDLKILYDKIWENEKIETKTLPELNINWGETHELWKEYFDKIKIPSPEVYQYKVNDFKEKRQKLEEIKDLTKKYSHIKIDEVEFSETNPSALFTKANNAKEAYKSYFEDIANFNLKSEATKFIDENLDFIALGREILPNILRNESNLSDEDVVEKTDSWLHTIAEKSFDFTKGKAKNLKIILEELSNTIEEYKTLHGRIRNFFTGQKANGNLISNEFEIKMKWQEGILKEKWLTDFSKNANDWNGLFQNIALEELLSQKISFDEFTISAFEKLSESIAKPDIKKLLDPNSYFSLDFKMKKDDGWDNMGISTGQNYAAVALLCIARLSIIEKPKIGKKDVKGIRFMPIDEAEGLGSNFDMLYRIAQDEDYQIITMSIGTLDFIEEGKQTIYILHRNFEETKMPINYPPEKISNTLLNEKENYATDEMEILESIE